MDQSVFKVGDVAYLNSNPKVIMYVVNVNSNKLIRVKYFKTGLVRASSDFIPKLFELQNK